MLSDDPKSAGSSDEGSDAWVKLEISPKAIGSVPYSNLRINVYQHSANRKTNSSNGENKFYYAPIALLDTTSAISSLNNANNQAEIKFRIEMWNEDVQAAVARWIKQEVDDTVKDSLVQVIPFEKLILTGSSLEASQQHYRLPKDWTPYQLQKDVRIKLTCFTKVDCDQLANQMRQYPDQFSHLRLLFSVASDKTLQKQVSIRSENIQLSDLIAKVEQRLPQSEFVLLNALDEQRLLSDFASTIVSEAFGDTDVIAPNSEAQLLKPIKEALLTTGKTIKDQGDKTWASVYWHDESSRPDKCAKTWNDIYKKLDSENQKMLIDSFIQSADKQIGESLLNSIREIQFNADQKDYNDEEFLKTLYEGSKNTVEWNGEKFVPKSWSPSRLDMIKLRNSQTFKDKNVKVKYSKAALSVAVNVPSASSSSSSIITPMVRGIIESSNLSF